MALASMILGIVGVVFLFVCAPIGVVLGLVGLPLGGISLQRVNKGQAPANARGQAIAGLVLSIIAVIPGVAVMLIFGGLFTTGMFAGL